MMSDSFLTPRFADGGVAGKKIGYATVYNEITRMQDKAKRDGKELTVDEVQARVLEMYSRI